MATQLQIRRGTTAQMGAFTGAEGELAVNTSTDTVHVHDGSTAGGFALAKADGSNIGTYAGSFTTLAASGAVTLSSTLAVSGEITANGGIALGDSDKATFGASDDLQIYHDGTDSFLIDNGTGRLNIRSSSDFLIANTANNQNYLYAVESGAVTLFHSGSTKLATTATGIDVTGTATMGAMNVTSGLASGTGIGAGGANGNLRLYANGVQVVTVATTGNVGIGTSLPSVNLEITESGSATNSVADVLKLNHITSGTAASGLGAGVVFSSERPSGGINLTRGAIYGISGSDPDDDGALAFYTRTDTSGSGFSEKLRIDASGNVGLGVVPSADNFFTTLEIGNTGNGLVGRGAADTHLMSGLIWDGASTQEYTVSSVAVGKYQITNGIHYWGTAPAGTAGTAATLQTNMTLDASGNLLVGTTSASGSGASTGKQVIQFAGASENGLYLDDTRTSSGTDNAIIFGRGATYCGKIETTTAPATNYVSASDQRLKENIADADDAGSKIDAIQVRKYDWIGDGTHQEYGLVAQELQPIAPLAVSGDADSEDMMGVDYSKLVPMLIKEIQSLRTRVQTLENN